MKIIYTIIALSMLNTVSGQTVRGVGINTDDPKQTLDIEGSLRIDSVPFVDKENFEPLSWNEKGDIAPDGTVKNQGKIIPFKDDDSSPVKEVEYRFHIQAANEDWINGIDLGIPKDKYTVVVVDFAMLDENLDPVYMKVMGSVKKSNGVIVKRAEGPLYLRSNKGDRGKVGVSASIFGERFPGDTNIDKDLLPASDGEIDVVTGSPIIVAYPDSQGPNWRFYADYPSTTPASIDIQDLATYTVKEKGIDPSKKYIWSVSFLVINKSFMKRNGEVYSIDVGNDDTGEFTQPIDPVTGLPPVN